MPSTRLAPLTLIFFALGCASDPAAAGEDPEAGLAPDDVGSFDDSKADLGSIDWRRPEAPTPFTLGEPHAGSVAYSQCYQVEDGSADLTIQCDPAWSEVAWYRVAREDVEAALAEGTPSFVVAIASADPEQEVLVRASIHAVGEDGTTTRLASLAQLFDGDTIVATPGEAAELYVYVAKGRTLGPWSNGTIDFVVTPYFE